MLGEISVTSDMQMIPPLWQNSGQGQVREGAKWKGEGWWSRNPSSHRLHVMDWSSWSATPYQWTTWRRMEGVSPLWPPAFCVSRIGRCSGTWAWSPAQDCELGGCSVRLLAFVAFVILFLQPHEALGALGDEVQLSVLWTALCGYHLKQCQDPGDVVVARAMWPLALYPGRPHHTLGLGELSLVGVAGGEAGDDILPDAGLAAGLGQVRLQMDCRQVTPCPVLPARPQCCPGPQQGGACFLLNKFVGRVGLRFFSEEQRGSLGWEMMARCAYHLSGSQFPLVLWGRGRSRSARGTCLCLCPHMCLCALQRPWEAAKHPAWIPYPHCLQPGLSKSPDSPGVRPHSNACLLVNSLGTWCLLAPAGVLLLCPCGLQKAHWELPVAWRVHGAPGLSLSFCSLPRLASPWVPLPRWARLKCSARGPSSPRVPSMIRS